MVNWRERQREFPSKPATRGCEDKKCNHTLKTFADDKYCGPRTRPNGMRVLFCHCQKATS